jgi:hypothetical protein
LKKGAMALSALLACALLSACGNLTAGGFTGEATVTVSGDAVDAPMAAPQRAVGPSSTAPLAMSGGGPEGEVQADFFLYLETAAGNSVSLSEDEIRIRLDVQGRQEVDAVDRTPVTATQYSQMRIVFTDIRVDVADGLIINGVPVVGAVRVELKDTALTVIRPLNLDIRDGDSVFLLMDLNANTWLQAVDPVLKVIAEDVFGEAVSVVVR